MAYTMRTIQVKFAAAKDDWQRVGERSERKKIQNRLNQRALRKRKKKDEIQTSEKRPYHVTRWRIEQPVTGQNEPLTLNEGTSQSSPDSLDNSSIKTSTPVTQSPSFGQIVENTMVQVQDMGFVSQTTLSDFPLSADHLIRVVHLNVFSALMKNKTVLAASTYSAKIQIPGPAFILPPSRDFCDGLTVIHPITSDTLPSSLDPTALQKSTPHASWLNMFPFPRFRDNLILHEAILDSADLLYDIFGDICYDQRANPALLRIAVTKEQEVDMHAGRKGLIVWGEPWDVQGWEITTGFMRKWAWLLEGCEDLIATSNRWRAMRDEIPLEVEIVGD